MATRRGSSLLATGLLLVATRARAQQPTPNEAEEPVPSETQAEPSAPPIPPPPPAGKEPAPGAPSDPSTNEADKRIGVGVDALLVAPLGDLASSTGPIVGPVLRFGYRVVPILEIALRGGYLFGTKVTEHGAISRVDVLPLWLGARLFLWKPFVGPYLAVEGGMNSFLPTVDSPPSIPDGKKHTELRRRFGGNLGAGVLVSEHLPLDIRAQVMLLNLIGQDAALDENLNVAVSLSAGYTFQF
jgi:hypothetical protein